MDNGRTFIQDVFKVTDAVVFEVFGDLTGSVVTLCKGVMVRVMGGNRGWGDTGGVVI